MDLLAGYDSDASSEQEDVRTRSPDKNPSSASESTKGKLSTTDVREESATDKPGVRKVNLKTLASLLPPPKAGSDLPSNLGKRDGDSDDEGQEPLWKRLKAQKSGGGLSLSALLPKPVYDGPSAGRTGKIDAPSKSADESPGFSAKAVAQPDASQPPARAGSEATPPASKAVSSSALASSDPPKKFKMSFGGNVSAAPRLVETSSANLRPSTFLIPSAAPSLTTAAPSYGTHSASAYEVGGVGISYEHVPGPSAPHSVEEDADGDETAAGVAPSGFSLPEAGLDRHMRKALASGGVSGMPTVSVAQLSGSWDPRTAEQQKKEKVGPFCRSVFSRFLLQFDE
jgi:hypothetical protein